MRGREIGSLYRFCPKCGLPLETRYVENDERDRLVCGSARGGCGFIFYLNSKPCASALVVHDGKVLMVRRAIEPFKGYWDIPGGFLENGEHPEAGAIREVREETGLEVRLTGLLGIYMDIYPYGEHPDQEYTLNIFYLAEVLPQCVPVGGVLPPEGQPASDADAMEWFAKDVLPDRIAFRCCRQVLEEWSALGG